MKSGVPPISPDSSDIEQEHADILNAVLERNVETATSRLVMHYETTLRNWPRDQNIVIENATIDSD